MENYYRAGSPWRRSELWRMILMLFHIDGKPYEPVYIGGILRWLRETVIWNKISLIDITQAKKHRCKSLNTAYPPTYLSVCLSLHLSIYPYDSIVALCCIQRFPHPTGCPVCPRIACSMEPFPRKESDTTAGGQGFSGGHLHCAGVWRIPDLSAGRAAVWRFLFIMNLSLGEILSQ